MFIRTNLDINLIFDTWLSTILNSLTYLFHQLITTTTTDTYLTIDVYELDGIAAPPTASVSGPTTLLQPISK